MKFSNLSIADLATHEIAEIENAANPANPANPIDLYEKHVANLLLISANPLLIGPSDSPPILEISNRLANFSNGLANRELLIPDANQTDTETLARLATLAASEEDKTLQEAVTVADKALQDQALKVLQRLHAQHVANLKVGGHDGKGALVRRDDYWRALRKARLNPETAFDLLDAGRVSIQADGLYWIPVKETAP